MSVYLGIDTSNYTTSMALCDSARIICNLKRPLFVESGKRGLRQSDALFHHTKNLPELAEMINGYLNSPVEAIGVSAYPRDLNGSYMPCFLAGLSMAESLGSFLKVRVKQFSHQRGHIVAALYSSNAMTLYGGRFLAFHLSGGTTEALLVDSGNITLIGGTSDLTAGQLIDRTGVMLGLDFPCGAELEKLALASRDPLPVRPSIDGLRCSLSGGENKAGKMLNDGYDKCEIARFVFDLVVSSVDMIASNALKEYGDLPIVFSGGVSGSVIMRERLSKKYCSFFASTEYASDNAAGVALLCAGSEGAFPGISK